MTDILNFLPVSFSGRNGIIKPRDFLKEVVEEDKGKHDTIVKIGDINFNCEPWAGTDSSAIHKNQMVNVRMSFDGLLRGGDELPDVLDFDQFGGWNALRGLVNQMAPGSGFTPRALTSVPVNLSMANFEYWKTHNADRDVLIRWREPGTGRLGHMTKDRFPYARAILPASYGQLDNAQLMHDLMPYLEAQGLVVMRYFINDYRFSIQAVKANDLYSLGDNDEKLTFGIYISNSETGNADITIDHLAVRLVCANGMVGLVEDSRLMQVQHKINEITDFRTRVEAAFDKLNQLNKAAAEVYEQGKNYEVENLRKEMFDLFQLSRLSNKYLKLATTVLDTDYKGGEDGEGTRWNIVNALTKASQYIDNHDDSALMQHVAGAYARDGFRSVASAKALNLAEAIT